MNLQCVVVLCAFLPTILGGWLSELTSSRGLEIGNGFTLSLEDSENQNNTLIERYALRAEYGFLGMKVQKAPHKEAIELKLYQRDSDTNTVVQGRKRKGDGRVSIALIVGYKMATIVTLTFAMLKAMVIKALLMSKIALIMTGISLAHKFWHSKHHHHGGPYIEAEPEIIIPEYASSGVDYHPSAATNLLAYNNYVPSAVAASNTVSNYETIETVTNTSAATGNEPASVATTSNTRRRDVSKKKHPIPVVTVHRYTIES